MEVNAVVIDKETSARWRISSSKVGIPIGRTCDPSPLGMCTRRAGGVE